MIGLLKIPVRARLVSESEALALEEKRREVRERYEPKNGWLDTPVDMEGRQWTAYSAS